MSLQTPPCTARHLNHVCIAVRDIGETLSFYKTLFGLGPAEVVALPDQGVRACLLPLGGSQLELIEPTDPNGPVARFIELRGEGLHHIAFEVENISEALARLGAQGVELVDRVARPGLAGSIAFLHPRATRGVLIELVERKEGT